MLDEEYVVLLLRLAEDFIKYTAVIVQAGGYLLVLPDDGPSLRGGVVPEAF